MTSSKKGKYYFKKSKTRSVFLSLCVVCCVFRPKTGAMNWDEI